jgi:transcriptional regulator with XRE-family HTH domain
MSPTFGGRLRYERERRQIALRSIAESTKIGISLLEGLERDDVSRWPSGIFRKSFVRSYAEAIGLEPDAIVREFVERYPDPLEVVSAAPSASARSITTSFGATPPSSVKACHAEAPSGAKAGPLSIKLTITWSGSVHSTIGRLADWRIGRLRGLRGLLNLPIFQSSNLPMVNSANPHESAGAAQDPAQPV